MHERVASFRAAIFDLDGVVTRTARVHALAWKRMFDAFLEAREDASDEQHEPFDIEDEYRAHVDGKPRYEGAHAFLEARGIDLPFGDPDDPPGGDSVCALGNRKNGIFRQLVQEEGVETWPDAIERIGAWRDQGIRTALITSSRNGRFILEHARLTDLFDVRIDGLDAAEAGLAGKPAPDVFLEAARRLGVDPSDAVVIEDAVAGVQAGRSGGFGLVVGVARNGGSSLADHGADVVVRDLRELDLRELEPSGQQARRAAGTERGDGNRPVAEDAGGAREGAKGEDDVRAGPSPDGGAATDDREASPWELTYTAWRPERQGLREALCALGNGTIVTRAAFEEVSAGDVHYPGTYLAGGYNRLESEVAGRIIENEDLVNWPNWLPLTFRPAGGTWFELDRVEVLDFELRLDLHRGVLKRRVRFRDDEGRESIVRTRRIVHMTKPNLAAIEWTLTPLDWSGDIEIRTSLDGSVVNDNVERYRGLANQHLEVLETGWEGGDGMYLTVRTNQSHVRMTQAARTRAFLDGAPAPVRRDAQQSGTGVDQRLFTSVEAQKPLRVEKIVSIRTSLDPAISEPQVNARRDLRFAGSFEELLEPHAMKWRHLWSIADVSLENCDAETQLILRLHIFHLLQTVSTNTIDRDVGVPARGWHGEAYRGHIFWDELFIFPTLLLRIPELCRSLLMYRYRRLDEARRYAGQEGAAGAMFPWQSGSDGREESQVLHLNPRSGGWVPDTTHRQRHVNAAIAYNVWTYYQATGDRHFLSYYGAEMILEIARLFASLARFDAAKGRYVIEGVVGPDEFHTDDPNTDVAGLRNNAYTNVMAAWVLRCASGVLDLLDEERRGKLRDHLGLRDEELRRWDEIGRTLYVPFHADGVIGQFEGYDQLAPLDWASYRERYGENMRLDRILEAEGDDVNRYQAGKQADVLMLLYLFSYEQLQELLDHMGYSLDEGDIEATIAYYLDRSAHGSTLSQMVYAWILARRDRERAWGFWQKALRSDIDDIQGGTTPEGIHLGAMAGTVDLVERGHAGLVMEHDVLWFDPRLPAELHRVRMRIRYRHHWLTALITHDELELSFDRGSHPAVHIGFRGQVHEMVQGETRRFRLTT